MPSEGSERRRLYIPETVTFSTEMVTWESAEKILSEYNKMNRHQRKNRINEYADAMLDDQFLFTGDTLVYDTDGQLVNGQHRLSAQVESHTDVEYIIVRGVPPNVRPAVDAGIARKFSDDLTMSGMTNASAQSSLIGRIMNWDRNAGLANYWGPTRVRKAAVYPQYKDEIIGTLEATLRWIQKWPGSRGSLEFLYWLLMYRTENDQATVERFFSIMAIGSQAQEDYALIIAKDQMIRDRMEYVSKGGRKYRSIAKEVYIGIRAWNAWLTNDRVPASRYNIGRNGELVNPFPVPVQAERVK